MAAEWAAHQTWWKSTSHTLWALAFTGHYSDHLMWETNAMQCPTFAGTCKWLIFGVWDWGRERNRQKDRWTDETERQRKGQRQQDWERDRKTEQGRDRKTEKGIVTERQRKGQRKTEQGTERQRNQGHRQKDRARDRKTEKQRQKDIGAECERHTEGDSQWERLRWRDRLRHATLKR